MKKQISDFLNDEYKQQASNDNFTRIPNIFGLKVTSNKVIHVMLNDNINSWIKVDALANKTAGETLYLGGATNIESVIVGMGADYVGSNNINLIDRKGLFGSWMNRAASASRYIYVRKSKNLDKYFNRTDLNILPRYNFEGEDIEYQFFTFNIPLVLINGGGGIGTGHNCKILPSLLTDNIDFLNKKLKNPNLKYNVKPNFKGWDGTVEQGEEQNKWIIKGKIKRKTKFQTEILTVAPNETYVNYIKKLDKLEEQGKIKSYEDLCEPKQDRYHFIIKHQDFSNKTDDELLELFKLVYKVTENYTLNDENNKIVIFNSRAEIFEYWYELKLKYLQKRKDYLIKSISQNIRELISKYIFIKSIINKDLIITKRPDEDIINDLENIDNIIKVNDSFDYLLQMPIRSMTEKRMSQLIKQIKDEKEKLNFVKTSSLEEMWIKDMED